MSKEYDFLKKQRYEYYKGTTEIMDNEVNDLIEDVVDVLNQKDYSINELIKIHQHQAQRIAELEEQLKNCIRPKFKIGQEVWSIFENQYFIDCKELCNLEITAIMKTNKGVFYQGYVLEQGKNRSDYWFDEKKTFLAKEEAKVKLQELQGE